MVILVIVAIAVVVYLYRYAVVSQYRISAADAKRLISRGDVLVLDVRTDVERSTLGYYPGSVHIQSADLDRQMPVRFPDRNIPIVVYCNTGHRARLATDKLQALGFQKTRYISSGYKSLL